MIKMEIRAATILFSKRKARQKRDEEKKLFKKFNRLQDQIRANFNEVTKAEIDRVKNKLAKIGYYFHLRIWHEIAVRAKVKHQYSLGTFPRTRPRPRQRSGINLGLITLFLAVSQVYANHR